MKKLSILLIGLLLLTGFVFANDEFPATPIADIDITASVTWGVDLNPATPTTGFVNTGNADLKLTWIAPGDELDYEKGGDDDLYGWIKVNNVGLVMLDGVTTATIGAVEAKIVISPAEILIYAAPTMIFGNVAMIDAADAGLPVDLAETNVIGGITIVLPIDPVTLKVFLVSDGSGVGGTAPYAAGTNVNNDYAIGTNVKVVVDIITINVGGYYGWLNAATWGATAKAAVALADILNGVDISLAADIEDPGDWELGFGTTLKFSEANADDEKANLALSVVYGAAPGLDARVVFTEPKAGGLMDALKAIITLDVLNLTGTLGWNVNIVGEYTMMPGFTPSFTFDTGSDQIVYLMLKLALGADFTGIDLTTLTLMYVADDLTSMDAALLNDKGVVTVEAKVAF